MGIFDKLTGTKRPSGDLAPLPAEEVRDMLLALNGPDVPYVVRDGSPEGADLVAEWRLMEPAWQSLFARSELSRRIRIRMSFALPGHEVRALDEQWKVKWVEGVPVSSEYGRGPVKSSSRQWAVGRGGESGLEVTETFRFDSADLKDPVRNTVLKAGWTWRGLVMRQP